MLLTLTAYVSRCLIYAVKVWLIASLLSWLIPHWLWLIYMVLPMNRVRFDMNFFQKIFAKKEIIRARRYDMACSEIDRWLASDPKAVMIIEHITNYVNDKNALRPDKLRMQLEAIKQES